MDELLRDFVTETNESLDVVDVELVRFEQEPNNAKILNNIFRLVHTIKGTCGFLGLPRLEALAHSAETLMGRFRDGLPATSESVTLVLATIDRIKKILDSLEREQREPEGSDDDLISDLERMVERLGSAPAPQEPPQSVGSLTPQMPKRGSQPGESSLDELERVLLDIANSPDEVTPAQFESLRKRIESKGILFKVRVVNQDLREREKATKPSPEQEKTDVKERNKA